MLVLLVRILKQKINLSQILRRYVNDIVDDLKGEYSDANVDTRQQDSQKCGLLTI